MTLSLTHAALVARLRAAGCVYAEDEADLLLAGAASPAELAAMVEQRVGGLPLEHVLGWVEFAGIRVGVAPGVFVPRRRTELLVREAVAALSAQPRPATVVDLCCGCGALGAAVAAALAGAAGLELHAADIDPVAVGCARRNLGPYGGHVYQGDLTAPLPPTLRGRVDVLIANVPYVPTEAIALMPPEARRYERRAALDGGAEGLDVLRRVAAEAAQWLVPGGRLLVEISERQVPAATEIARHAGLTPQVVRAPDLDATALLASR